MFFRKDKLPFFVAEASANHSGKIKNLKKIIDSAKKYGADAIKIQSYEANTITVNSKNKKFYIREGLWKGKYLWDLYKKGQTPFKWHKEIFNYAKKKKIICFSTPFDSSAVELLENLDCPFYKISSFEITDLPLIKCIAETKKPIIISTGTSNLKEISEAFNLIKKKNSAPIAMLYCVSNYPSKNSDFNLGNIEYLKSYFNCTIGLSDHSEGNVIAQHAVALGAEIIEKHIGYENQKKGLDIKFSLTGKKIQKFRENIDETYKITRKKNYLKLTNDKRNIFYRRSIFAIKEIKKGEKLTMKNIKCLRPNIGMQPRYFFSILNKRVKKNIKINSPIFKEYIS